MTSNQLKQSEETVLEIIRAAKPVFAKEAPLSLAKEVQGLRAVFDEVRLFLQQRLLSLCVTINLSPKSLNHGNKKYAHCHVRITSPNEPLDLLENILVKLLFYESSLLFSVFILGVTF